MARIPPNPQLVDAISRVRSCLSEDDAREVADTLERLLESGDVSVQDVLLAVSAAIIERIDNILANTPLDERDFRARLHALALKAFSLYTREAMINALLDVEDFVKYRLEVDNLRLEAKSLEELWEKLRSRVEALATRTLDDSAEVLASNVAITDVEELERHYQSIRRALEGGAAFVLIVPRSLEGLLPLFFKEYYKSSWDVGKVLCNLNSLYNMVQAVMHLYGDRPRERSLLEEIARELRELASAIDNKWVCRESCTVDRSDKDYFNSAGHAINLDGSSIDELLGDKLPRVIKEVINNCRRVVEYSGRRILLKHCKSRGREYILVAPEGRQAGRVLLSHGDIYEHARKLKNVLDNA